METGWVEGGACGSHLKLKSLWHHGHSSGRNRQAPGQILLWINAHYTPGWHANVLVDDRPTHDRMPADVDPAQAVVVASPLTLEPVLASIQAESASHLSLRTSSDFPLSPFPIPLSTSSRLSKLSVYLI